ncbi:acetate--CoA ligase [Longibacter salinarum]|uniref:Acetate--CoA ligase n=1 Tax=Longibacter salinarum TaxID=1850348 RepID=A0A2A8D304_9BACT|nr:acetate--CoA ligase [Longibacter salinarum]PEN15254.1 acetate--CoA ligase [Longibacter salinarum]
MAIDRVLEQDVVYPPLDDLVDQANVTDFDAEYQRSIDDPAGFWSDWAQRFEWTTPWSSVFDAQFPHHRWFVGAKTNITANALDRHADGPRADKTAIVAVNEDNSSTRYTYAELRNLVSRFASGLQSLGIGVGDTVIIYMPLTIEGIIAMLACARIGAIHSVVYAGMGVGALANRIEDIDAKAVIAGDVSMRRGKPVDLTGNVYGALEEEPVDHVIWFRRETQPQSKGEIQFHDLIRDHEPDCDPVPVDAEHPLFVLYTSGSTGKPKGVVHVHGGYMVGTSYHLRSFFDVKDDDVYWATSDIGWIVGHSYIVYAPLVEGVTTVFREGAPDHPDPGSIWKVSAEHEVNVMFTAPTAIRMFMKHGEEYPQSHDLSSLRLIAVAGEPLNPEAWRWAFTNILEENGYVVDNWWQTELGGPTIGTPITMSAKPGAAGVPLPGVEASVVDADGMHVPRGKGGLLVLNRPFPHMMRTIWDNDARYKQYFDEVPGDVYSAGDVASMDEDGYISILGRSDDVLNVAGHRIGTADVESALIVHDAVAESAVIGIPHEVKGEAIKAFVVLMDGYEATEATTKSLVQHVRTELGPIATPSEIEFREKLPKTRSGKIVRRLLKAEEVGDDPGDLSTLED